jgi:hypothetical protein
MPVSRRQSEVDSWKRQVVAQELRIAESVATVSAWEDGDQETFRELLDEHFPQHTNACHSYSGCSFIAVCHEGAAAEPGELYQIRIPNHIEKEGEDG